MSIVSKPEWLRKTTCFSENYITLLNLLSGKKLNTVCQSAHCPNISECFNDKKATFLILGPNCTRNCSFCAIPGGNIPAPNLSEIPEITETIRILGLKYAVITSVTRDDLPDGGAGYFEELVKNIKTAIPDIKIELLVPDFRGDLKQISRILNLDICVFNHNMETIRRLYKAVRPGADYNVSRDILKYAAENHKIPVKTGIMVGLGEEKQEIFEFLDEMADFCDIVTIGQYLSPGKDKYPVHRYAHPEEFEQYSEYGKKAGIKTVYSGPFIRSSYNAGSVSGCLLQA